MKFYSISCLLLLAISNIANGSSHADQFKFRPAGHKVDAQGLATIINRRGPMSGSVKKNLPALTANEIAKVEAAFAQELDEFIDTFEFEKEDYVVKACVHGLKHYFDDNSYSEKLAGLMDIISKNLVKPVHDRDNDRHPECWYDALEQFVTEDVGHQLNNSLAKLLITLHENTRLQTSIPPANMLEEAGIATSSSSKKPISAAGEAQAKSGKASQVATSSKANPVAAFHAIQQRKESPGTIDAANLAKRNVRAAGKDLQKALSGDKENEKAVPAALPQRNIATLSKGKDIHGVVQALAVDQQAKELAPVQSAKTPKKHVTFKGPQQAATLDGAPVDNSGSLPLPSPQPVAGGVTLPPPPPPLTSAPVTNSKFPPLPPEVQKKLIRVPSVGLMPPPVTSALDSARTAADSSDSSSQSSSPVQSRSSSGLGVVTLPPPPVDPAVTATLSSSGLGTFRAPVITTTQSTGGKGGNLSSGADTSLKKGTGISFTKIILASGAMGIGAWIFKIYYWDNPRFTIRRDAQVTAAV